MRSNYNTLATSVIQRHMRLKPKLEMLLSQYPDKVMLHTTVPGEMRDRARALSAITTDSRTMVELFTKGLYDFLLTKPYLKKTFVWQETKSTFVTENGQKVDSGWVAINLQLGHVDLADGKKIAGVELASALVAIAGEHCQKTGKKSEGKPNLHRAVTTVLHHIVTVQFPPEKYPTAAPRKKASLPISVPDVIKDAPLVKRRSFTPGKVRDGWWCGAVLNEAQRAMFDSLGSGDWLKAQIDNEIAKAKKKS